MIKMIIPAFSGIVIVYLFLNKKISKKLMLICLVGTGIAGILMYSELQNGGRHKVTELEENEEENGSEAVQLRVKTEDGKEHAVEITIPERAYTAKEKKALLQKKQQQLDKEILGKNKSFNHIEWNLTLPESFSDSPVTCEWDSDHPEIVDWEGVLGADIPAKGTKVKLTGVLTLEEQELSYERILTVFPSKEEAALAEGLQKASEALNEQKSAKEGGKSSGYLLPSELNGQKIVWYRESEQRGIVLCGLFLFLAVYSVAAEKKKKRSEDEKRQEKLLREYPDLVSRIQLLTAAGLSLRQCMKRLAGEYTEVQRCWYEMESGVTEQDAYVHFGERCNTAEYKKLALLLAQSQKKGGRQLSMLLEQEVQEAFESRKRRARAEGEKASIRMIVPLGMMLVVVLVIIMVPAMFSF